MQNGIDDIKLIKQGVQFIVSGRSAETNGTLFLVRFYDYDNISRAQTIAKVMDGQAFSIRGVELERGLYTIGLQKVLNLRNQQLETEKRITTKVMAGDAYPIEIRCVEQNMYGHRGLKVTVLSKEKELDNRELYYQVLKAGNIYNKIRYWIPMAGQQAFEFFIADVGTRELKFEGAQPGIFTISVY